MHRHSSILLRSGAGGSAFDGIAEQPGLTAHDEGAYGIFDVVIVYDQTSILEIANEFVYARG